MAICPEDPKERILEQPCLVWSCKNHCERVELNCLGIERRSIIDAPLSASELAFYRQIPVAQVEEQIKSDHLSVKALITFEHFYFWVKENCVPQEPPWPGPSYGKWVTGYPMNSGEWPIDLNVIACMFDPEVWDRWVAEKGANGFNHSAVLHCRIGEMRAITRELVPRLAEAL